MLVQSLFAFAAATVTNAPCSAAEVKRVLQDRDASAPLVLVTTKAERFRIYGSDFIDARQWRSGNRLEICPDAPPRNVVRIRNVTRRELVVARQLGS